jgi:hypothetical protein
MMERPDDIVPQRKPARRAIRWAVLIVIGVLALVVFGHRYTSYLIAPGEYARKTPTFPSSSESLERTVGLPITESLQTIEFRLDRSGATVQSEALFVIEAEPREFVFDGPFLVYMQNRGAEHPFFAMWVDNAELLTER